MKKYILSLDQGTTSSKAILFDRAGAVHGTAQAEFPQLFPEPGWVEHDPRDIWRSQLAVAHEVMKQTGVTSCDIAAIGITNQRETTVVWDKATGAPISNAIVWQDHRTAGLCDALRRDGKAALFKEKTGLVLDAYFSGTKLVWILDNVPGAREKADRGELAFGTVDSWLIFNMSGMHVTDTSNASRTLLYNIKTMQWDDDLLAVLNIPRSMMPVALPGSAIFAQTRPELFGSSIPIAGVAGDQQAATFGQACHHPGMAKNTYGTGCFMLMNTGSEVIDSQNNLVSTVGWTLGEGKATHTDYMLEGSIFMAGAIVQWLRDGLGLIKNSADVEALALSVPNSGDITFVPAFTGLGAPYWDAHARGTIVGMTRGTTGGHIARAALESIAYQSVDVLDAMQKDFGMALKELRVDGGAACNDLLMQFQADVLGVPVVRPMVTETTALGAAYLAGLAVGFWSSKEEIVSQWKMDRRFEPTMMSDERLNRIAAWRRAVECSRRWAE